MRAGVRNGVVLALAVVTCAHGAFAQADVRSGGATESPKAAPSDEDRAAARAAASEGLRALDEARYQEALDLFTRAESLMHAPTHLLLIARAQTKLGRLVKAHETYLKLEREEIAPDAPRAFSEAKDKAKEEGAAVQARLGWLRVDLAGEGAADAQKWTVMLDDLPMPAALIGIERPIDPGAHRLRASRDGKESDVVEVKIAEGEKKSATLQLPGVPASGEVQGSPRAKDAPQEDSGGSSLRSGAWIAFGVGAVGAIAGTFFLLKNRSNRDDANALCPGGPCPASKHDDIAALDDNANTAAIFSWVGYGVGVAGVATGVVLLLMSGGKPAAAPQATRVLPWIGPHSAGARVTF
jgi:hypothetical protein